jgi:hypothetical protein
MRPTLPEVQVAPPPRGIGDAPRQRSVAPEPPAVQRLAPDVHIGAIHVTVDAQRPPAPPIAPVAPVAPPPPAARSDFLRSRAPRL